MKHASIYRFGDCAALHSGSGETRYLRAKAARAMAKKLYEVARSIESDVFYKSSLGTLTVQTFGIDDPQMHDKESRK